MLSLKHGIYGRSVRKQDYDGKRSAGGRIHRLRFRAVQIYGNGIYSLPLRGRAVRQLLFRKRKIPPQRDVFFSVPRMCVRQFQLRLAGVAQQFIHKTHGYRLSCIIHIIVAWKGLVWQSNRAMLTNLTPYTQTFRPLTPKWARYIEKQAKTACIKQ